MLTLRTTAFFILLMGWYGCAQAQSPTPLWSPMAAKSMAVADGSAIVAKAYYQLDLAGLHQRQQDQPNRFSITVPLPDGTDKTLYLTPNGVLPEALQQRYADIHSYNGRSADGQLNGKFELTPQGFHGFFTYRGQKLFIDPLAGSTIHYRLYQAEQQKLPAFSEQLRHIQHQPAASRFAAKPSVDGQVREYRLAIATTGEYSEQHGNTPSTVLAAIVTVVDRINQVYEVDMGVSFSLVADEDKVIFTDANTDPFNNNSDDIDLVGAVLDQHIGNANYDIGHVFTTNGGGLATVGVVCLSSYKAQGVTGIANTSNDVFYLDYVAHEIGHQLGASHTFNATEASCSGNRESTTPYEPGSGSTIMSYAGICGEQDITPHVGAYFHIGSILQYHQQVNANLSGNCGTLVNGGNLPPTADAGSDYTIPANTPFMLTATATDSELDSLTYNWEQFFNFAVSTTNPIADPTVAASGTLTEMNTDDGTRPLFRSWPPSASPVRYLPRLQDIASGTLSKGEIYPATDRTLRFRLSVRDNQGGLATDEMMVNVTTAAGPLQVTAPDGNAFWQNGGNYPVSWDVANTDLAPVSCSHMDVILSTDGGLSFGPTLASNVANNGTANVTFEGVSDTTRARIILKCRNNIFFAMNDANFTIQGHVNRPPVAVDDSYSVTNHKTATLLPVLSNDTDADNNPLTLSAVDYQGKGIVTISNNQISYTPATGYAGTEIFYYQVEDTAGAVDTGTITVIVKPKSSGGALLYLNLLLLLLGGYRRCLRA